MTQRFIEDLGKLNLEFNIKIYHILKEEGINTPLIKKSGENDLEMETLSKYPISIMVRNYIDGKIKERFMLEDDIMLNFPIVEYVLEKSGNLVNSRLYDFEQGDDITLFEMKFIDSKIKQINFILNKKFYKFGVRFAEYTGYFGKSRNGTNNYICDFSLRDLRIIKSNEKFDTKLYLHFLNNI